MVWGIRQGDCGIWTIWKLDNSELDIGRWWRAFTGVKRKVHPGQYKICNCLAAKILVTMNSGAPPFSAEATTSSPDERVQHTPSFIGE
jgi:hypothetical protein